MASLPPAHPFPGGTSVSHLRVYDWPTTDGAGVVGGGTPHLHTASDEGYVVLRGSGAVQTLGPDGYAEHRLWEGTALWFQPGVVHRLINDGDLEILVIMSNAGLPEAGDAIMTFPAEVLADVGRYRAAAALPAARPGAADDPATDDAALAAAARARRDLAVEGFGALRDRVLAEGPGAPMQELYDAAARLVRDRVPGWRATWEATVAAAARTTDQALTDLAAGVAPHLSRAQVASTPADPGLRYGMCGRLTTWHP
ncbi:Cupin domain-containing protein [Sanguibacter gelidistatuariae]|uniref:Cupin domain-containing protein n=1 Tax=Sanguibacter gelidistatuariae TaxID=1814289 RepID=A0A1G6UNU1_9MICO|nr:cupin domain-containing protein [Sanguibacter gelidistatuariae]SDD42904.1 Cupin domain-containing protein [Sanguibacter gelidistatuariae]